MKSIAFENINMLKWRNNGQILTIFGWYALIDSLGRIEPIFGVIYEMIIFIYLLRLLLLLEKWTNTCMHVFLSHI